MFIDELTIHARAGKGGDGVVRFRHEKGREFGGPSGGDGGKGGDVFLRAIRDISALSRYINKKEFFAENGGHGKNKSMKGADGTDLYIDIPIGSVVTNIKSGEQHELLEEGEIISLLYGGEGGYGNENFKSSVNQAPRKATPGNKGDEGTFLIELKLVVDAGLIGLPNAGKSSLLNALSHARAKVADYPFTTLEPNLGDFYGHILADIPGLIEGASDGKGLGHKFLRHIMRTRVLLHCLSLEEKDPRAAYDTVRGELVAYGQGLDMKKEIIVLTKADTVDKKRITVVKKLFPRKKILAVSILDDALLKDFSDNLAEEFKGKT